MYQADHIVLDWKGNHSLEIWCYSISLDWILGKISSSEGSSTCRSSRSVVTQQRECEVNDKMRRSEGRWPVYVSSRKTMGRELANTREGASKPKKSRPFETRVRGSSNTALDFQLRCSSLYLLYCQRCVIFGCKPSIQQSLSVSKTILAALLNWRASLAWCYRLDYYFKHLLQWARNFERCFASPPSSSPGWLSASKPLLSFPLAPLQFNIVHHESTSQRKIFLSRPS